VKRNDPQEAELQAKDLLLKMRQDFEKETKSGARIKQHGKAFYSARKNRDNALTCWRKRKKISPPAWSLDSGEANIKH